MATTATFDRRRVLAVLASVLAAPAAARAQALSERDRADVARAEAYLDSIRTLSARFVQIGPDGSVAEGTFELARPGRLRLDYDPPNPNLLVSDGRAFVHVDRSLRTIAYLPVDSTPAALFVRETIRLSGDVAVVGVERGPAVLRVTLVQANDPRAGRLVLAFGERPFALANWAFVDAQGQTTRVTLVDAREGGTIAPARFAIEDPGGARPAESR